MPQVFKAWVPNVSGALSFSAIGSGCYPDHPVRANIGDQKIRYLVAYQRRELIDAISPFFARRRGYLGEFVCLCVASSSDDPMDTSDLLQGKLFIFHDLVQWETSVQPLVVSAQEKLREFAGVMTGAALLSTSFGPTVSNLHSLLPAFSSFFIDFSLTRSGIASLSIPDDYEAHISPSAPIFPTDTLQRQHAERVVCSQLFFFLKDLCHNHQHHDPKADTIVDIHPANGNDLEWRAKVLRVLYRKIIEFKRNSRGASFHSSLGILLYAKSFRGITFREMKKELPPVIQDELLEDAIKAGIQNTCFSVESDTTKNNLNLYIAILTFLLTVSMLLSLTDYKVKNPHPFLMYLGDFLVQKTALLLGFFGLIYILGNMKFSGKFDLADYKISRNVLIFLQPLDQRVAGNLLIICGILLVIGLIVFLGLWYPSLVDTFYPSLVFRVRDLYYSIWGVK